MSVLSGELSFRTQNMKDASAFGLPWKKAFFDLVIGITKDGVFYPVLTEPDWSLQEATNGDLYAMNPSSIIYDRKTGTVLQTSEGKDRYRSHSFFVRESDEQGAKLIAESFAGKNAINDAAIAAYKSGAAVANGVGSRRAAAAPAGAVRTTEGADVGLPGGPATDEDDLPFG